MLIYKTGINYTLYLGDVIDVVKRIPDESIDAVISSPPYNMNLSHRYFLKNEVGIKYENWEDNLDWNDYVNWQVEVLNECFRIVKSGGVLFYNHKDRFKNNQYTDPLNILLKTKWRIKQTIIWNKGSASSYNNGFFGDVYEKVYFCYKGTSPRIKTSHSVLGSVWNLPREINNSHPAPFPLELPVRCIYSIFDDEENKVILDPFSGSGTTGVASLLLGHKYIGIDISEKYLKKSIKRLDNYESESERAQLELDRYFVKGKYENPKKIGKQLTIFEV